MRLGTADARADTSARVDETVSRRIEYAAVNTRRHNCGDALRSLGAIVVALAAHGCAAHSAGAAGSDVKGAPATSSAPEAEAARQKIADEITAALLREDFKAAAAVVERARQLSPPVRPSAKFVAYFDATVHAYQGDFRGAIKVMYDHIATVGPTAMDAFSFHDAMIALRTADGDLLGALVECEEMTRAGALGTWSSSDPDRMTLVRLKEHWHRAYLLRMIAQTLTGDERQAFISYAEAARQDYVALAAPLRSLGDSIAVLNAYFAFCDGDRVRMREAARRVNVAADDDVEDLYLVQLALDGAGDGEAAAAVRTRIAALTFVTVLTPVFAAWMRADQAPPDQPRPFSPRNPMGARPGR